MELATAEVKGDIAKARKEMTKQNKAWLQHRVEEQAVTLLRNCGKSSLLNTDLEAMKYGLVRFNWQSWAFCRSKLS